MGVFEELTTLNEGVANGRYKPKRRNKRDNSARTSGNATTGTGTSTSSPTGDNIGPDSSSSTAGSTGTDRQPANDGGGTDSPNVNTAPSGSDRDGTGRDEQSSSPIASADAGSNRRDDGSSSGVRTDTGSDRGDGGNAAGTGDFAILTADNYEEGSTRTLLVDVPPSALPQAVTEPRKRGRPPGTTTGQRRANSTSSSNVTEEVIEAAILTFFGALELSRGPHWRLPDGADLSVVTAPAKRMIDRLPASARKRLDELADPVALAMGMVLLAQPAITVELQAFRGAAGKNQGYGSNGGNLYPNVGISEETATTPGNNGIHTLDTIGPFPKSFGGRSQ